MVRAEADVSEAEASTDHPCVAKKALDPVRAGVRDDVEVLRLEPDEQVPDAPAHEIGLVPEVLQATNDRQRVLIEHRVRETGLAARREGFLIFRGHSATW